MTPRAKMPIPAGDLSPQQLCDRIRDWAAGQGYTFAQGSHATEFGKVVVRDPNGGQTWTTIPNPHHGKRLRRDQVRYIVQQINNRWS
jgi:hypothetical protein